MRYHLFLYYDGLNRYCQGSDNFPIRSAPSVSTQERSKMKTTISSNIIFLKPNQYCSQGIYDFMCLKNDSLYYLNVSSLLGQMSAIFALLRSEIPLWIVEFNQVKCVLFNIIYMIFTHHIISIFGNVKCWFCKI